MIITKAFLQEKRACQQGIDVFESSKLEGLDIKDVVKFAINSKDIQKIQWANWLIVRTMTKKQYVSYAIFAAEQVIDIYEKKHPGDERPREAIHAAKKVLENDTKKNRAAAYAAAYADVAADADAAAAYAAAAAAYAADAAADAAAAAAYAAAAAAAAAADAAAYAAAYADVAAARLKILTKILDYGVSLLEEQK